MRIIQRGRSSGTCGMTKRAGQMRCAGDAQQDLALGERLGHQAELVVLEVAQAAVDQLRGGRRGRAGEIVLLDQQHRQAAPRGVARDAGAVDAAADHQQVVASRSMRSGNAHAQRDAVAARQVRRGDACRRGTRRSGARCTARGRGAASPAPRRRRAPTPSTRTAASRIVSGSSGPLFATVSSGGAAGVLERDATGAPAREKSTAFSTSLSSSCAARSGAPSHLDAALGQRRARTRACG